MGNIDKNGAAISNNSNAVAEATKCTAVDWSYSCCTSANSCSFGKGDCDSSDHSTCSGDLRCGTDNCLRDFGFGDSGADCCYLETVSFDAWRESDFDASDWTKITYENVRQSTNYQAMDKGTGVFTAPLAGTYQLFIDSDRMIHFTGVLITPK